MSFLKENALLFSLALAVIAAGASLMMVSQKVYDTQKTVQKLDQEILAKQWNIRALKGELAYLSRPDRLEQISTAIAHSGPMPQGMTAIAPVSYSISDDLPPAMSLLPPEKPFIEASYKKTPIKREVKEPARATPKKTVQSEKKPATKGEKTKTVDANFNALLDNLGGVQ